MAQRGRKRGPAPRDPDVLEYGTKILDGLQAFVKEGGQKIAAKVSNYGYPFYQPSFSRARGTPYNIERLAKIMLTYGVWMHIVPNDGAKKRRYRIPQIKSMSNAYGFSRQMLYSAQQDAPLLFDVLCRAFLYEEAVEKYKELMRSELEERLVLMKRYIIHEIIAATGAKDNLEIVARMGPGATGGQSEANFLSRACTNGNYGIVLPVTIMRAYDLRECFVPLKDPASVPAPDEKAIENVMKELADERRDRIGRERKVEIITAALKYDAMMDERDTKCYEPG